MWTFCLDNRICSHVECRPLWACLLQRLKSPIQTVRACLLEGRKTGPNKISARVRFCWPEVQTCTWQAIWLRNRLGFFSGTGIFLSLGSDCLDHTRPNNCGSRQKQGGAWCVDPSTTKTVWCIGGVGC
jgi:hypothetical protein